VKTQESGLDNGKFIMKDLYLSTLVVIVASVFVMYPGTCVHASDWKDVVISCDDIKHDLEFLRKTLLDVHPNIYANVDADVFQKQYRQTLDGLKNPLSTIDFLSEVAKLLFIIKDYHTTCSLSVSDRYKQHIKENPKILPVIFHWDERQSCHYVLAARDTERITLGSKVIKINDMAMNTFIEKCAIYSPHIRPDYPDALEQMVGFWMFLWLEFGERDTWHLTIEAPDGQGTEVYTKGVALSELASPLWRPIVTVGINHRMLKDDNAVVLKSDTFAHADISEGYEAIFREIRENNIARLIIDLRNNPGGGSGPAERLLEYITEKPFVMMAEGQVKISQQARDARPNQKEFFTGEIGSLITDISEPIIPRQLENRFKGKIYVLIGRRTASAASNFAQVVKHYGLGTLVGEETSGTTVGPGEQIPVKMPRSGLVVGISTKFFKEPGGEPNGRGVQPDHVVTLTRSDIQRNGDPVLEYVLKTIRESGNENGSASSASPALGASNYTGMRRRVSRAWLSYVPCDLERFTHRRCLCRRCSQKL